MRIRFIAATAVLALLPGCAATAQDKQREHEDTVRYMKRHVEVIQLDVDGRKVPCAVYASGNGGGISCDWSER